MDRRTDVWAFGCVLYEMLTGKRAFAGDSVSGTLTGILEREPDLAALSPETPPAVRRLLSHCLEKDRSKRLPQVAIAAFQIDEVLESTPTIDTTTHRAAGWRSAQAAALALVAGVVVVSTAVVWSSAPRAVPAQDVTRLLIGVTPADQIGGTDGRPERLAMAMSPDGRTLVLDVTVDGQHFLLLQDHKRAPEAITHLMVVQNWHEELNRLVSPK